MRRAVAITVPLDENGNPELQLPAEVSKHREGRAFHVRWQGYYLHVKFMGAVASNAVFVGVGDQEILAGLAHLGAGVKLLKDVTSTQRTWLEARGVVWENGYPVAPHVMAGDSPHGVGSDYQLPEE